MSKEMVKEFVCPGCVCGLDPNNCEAVEIKIITNRECVGCFCAAHVCGTTCMPGGTIALGLPRGFCKAGWSGNGQKEKHRNSTMLIRCWSSGNYPEWNNLNVPVWAMEKDGYLFVRTWQPRINFTMVDVVEGGTLELVPNAINVAEFIDEID